MVPYFSSLCDVSPPVFLVIGLGARAAPLIQAWYSVTSLVEPIFSFEIISPFPIRRLLRRTIPLPICVLNKKSNQWLRCARWLVTLLAIFFQVFFPNVFPLLSALFLTFFSLFSTFYIWCRYVQLIAQALHTPTVIRLYYTYSFQKYSNRPMSHF